MNDSFNKIFSITKQHTANKLEEYIKTSTELQIKEFNKSEMQEYEQHLLEMIKRRNNNDN